jgi:hypothetical protein
MIWAALLVLLCGLVFGLGLEVADARDRARRAEREADERYDSTDER